MAGSTDGLLMVWKWESGVEITRIQAHKSRLHHCTVVSQPGTVTNTHMCTQISVLYRNIGMYLAKINFFAHRSGK